MNNPNRYAALSDVQLQRVHAACESFEQALQTREPNRIEDCLAAVAEELRGHLFRELLAIELERQIPRGPPPRMADYQGRFPDRSDDIEQVFDAGRTPEIDPASPSPASKSSITLPPSQVESRDGSSTTPSEPLPFIPGYEILGVLGRGGMGIVYKARHLALKRTVALKMILAVGQAGSQALVRFRIEAEAVARLQHPNIVQIHEVGTAGGHPYCALEFVEGGTLASKIDGKPQPARESARLVEALARAMHLAHSRNVVHRDLKPANILLAAGELGASATGVPRITDFGLARQTDSDSGETQFGAVIGTPSYMAPEQASGGAHEAGPAADVYALGAILYDCLAGRPPFRGATITETLDQVRTREPLPPSHWHVKVPLDLETVCLKCLRKEPENRYASAAELADELGRFLRGEPVQARASGRIEKTWRWRRRNPAVASLLALVAVTLLLGVTATSFFAFQANRRAEAETRARQDAEAEKALALQQKDRAERISAVATLLRVGSTYETDPGAARALLEDTEAIRVDLRDPAWGFYRNYCRRKVRNVPGHTREVLAVAWNPDGKTLASAGLDSTIKLWDVPAGKERATLTAVSWVATVSFSPDGKTLASAGWDLNITLWDVATGKKQATLTGHTKVVRSVAWSPDGKTLASGSEDRTIYLWDVATRKQRAALQGHRQAVNSVAWSPDGKTLASGGGEANQPGELKLWVAETGVERVTLPGPNNMVYAVAWSPDSKTLASVDLNSEIWLWDAANGISLGPLEGHSCGKHALAWSADGETLAAGGGDKTVKLWDVARRRERASFNGHPQNVRSVAFSPDSKTLASACADGAIKLWEVSSGPECAVLQPHNALVHAVSLSRDGKTLASGSWDRTIKLWDTATGKNTATFQGNCWCWSVAFSPDGKTLASASGDTLIGRAINKPGELKLWDVASGQERKSLIGHASSVQSAAWSPDGKTLASGSADTTIRLWDPASGEERATLRGHTAPVWSVAWSPDGKTLASASQDFTIKLWDVASGQGRTTLRGHTSWVNSVKWSPDGKTLASAGWDQTIKLWDVASGKNTTTLNAHNSAVSAIAWAPDGKTLASAGGDQTIKLWDLASGQLRATLKSSSAIAAMTWSTDGKTLASGEVGLIKLWDLNTAP